MQITRLIDLPEVSISHDPQLKKKVMVDKGSIPHLLNFSQVVITPGKTVSLHKHEDKWEVFFVSAGMGVVQINGSEFALNLGTCVVVEPLEEHGFANTGKGDLVLTFFGMVA